MRFAQGSLEGECVHAGGGGGQPLATARWRQQVRPHMLCASLTMRQLPFQILSAASAVMAELINPAPVVHERKATRRRVAVSLRVVQLLKMRSYAFWNRL